jgi:hypothetical protein
MKPQAMSNPLPLSNLENRCGPLQKIFQTRMALNGRAFCPMPCHFAQPGRVNLKAASVKVETARQLNNQ